MLASSNETTLLMLHADDAGPVWSLMELLELARSSVLIRWAIAWTCSLTSACSTASFERNLKALAAAAQAICTI